MLVRDENWTKKQDEIAGEMEFNQVTVSAETHLKRNSFLNNNSLELLRVSGTDLSGKSILVVGSSMAEAECFSRLAATMTSLDIVPDLTVMYRDACVRDGLNVGWVCGDGECLPFPSDSFDVVIVRQALHHMIRYYSAISEFFRVTRLGGKVIIIEEPYSLPEMNHPALVGVSDQFNLFEGVTLGEVRSYLRGEAPVAAERSVSQDEAASIVSVNFSEAEKSKDYIPAIQGDAESLLADKYHSFSAVELIVALRLHTEMFELIWPQNVGWARQVENEVVFESGPNSALEQPLVVRLSQPTTFSAVATKTRPTNVLRSRSGLLPIN
jgi:SAM-dependent methyltransferase